jgi:hypothetical protein
MTTMRPSNPTTRPHARTRGFAFTEILFAVMVLALGFIMIAAMFPVTIRQTQSTVEETVGAHLAKGAVDYLQGIASDDLFPYTCPPRTGVIPPQPDLNQQARFVSFKDIMRYDVSINPPPLAWGRPDPDPTKTDLFPAYYTVRGNMINANNPRTAWIPFYRREANSQVAQVIVIAVQSRNRDQYLAQQTPTQMYTDFNRPDPAFPPPGFPPAPAVPAATLEPQRVGVDVTFDAGTGHGVVQLDAAGRGRAAPGAYLVIALDPTTHPTSNRVGQSTGRVYQLGNAIDEAGGTWELNPGSEMIRTQTPPTTLSASDDNDIVGGTAYLIGRGYADPVDATQGYAGPAQDIAFYTGFISIPPNPLP